MTFKPGDSVLWLHEPRGGYSLPYRVPATVVKVNPKSVTIDAKKPDGGVKRIRVNPEMFKKAP